MGKRDKGLLEKAASLLSKEGGSKALRNSVQSLMKSHEQLAIKKAEAKDRLQKARQELELKEEALAAALKAFKKSLVPAKAAKPKAKKSAASAPAKIPAKSPTVNQAKTGSADS